MDKTFGTMVAELAGWGLLMLVVFSPVWIFLTVAGMIGMCS